MGQTHRSAPTHLTLFNLTISNPTMTLQDFLSEWNNDTLTVKVRTSGSTGTPKEMLVEKERMVNSARMTCNFLNLKRGDKALLCMPVDYIAGKMMVVRSIVAEMQLTTVEPSRHPLAGISVTPDFTAMTPMQVAHTFENTDEMETFRQIKCVIIGGGAIDHSLEEKLKDCPNAVWSSYGMTETLSHIALRRVSGQSASQWYTPLEGIDVSLSDESTLIINAPNLHAGTLHTNDIAEMNADGHFRIIGRRDNTINSGGVKIQIEEVEEKLKNLCPSIPFIITSRPDPVFGETVVALIPKSIDKMKKKTFIDASLALPRYWKPKHIIEVDELPLTETNKPDRAKAKELAKAGVSL